MASPPQQLDLLGGLADKRNGIARAISHAAGWYMAAFLACIERLPRGARFTSEDITLNIGMPPGSPNAVGALMHSAAARGLCVKTGDTTRARRRKCHAALLLIWVRC